MGELPKVAVGLSGGVDSAVCTLLLKQAGYQPVGVFLKMHQVGNEAEAARRAAEELGIPFYLKDMTRDFERLVMAPFAEMYKRGATPNPCLLCNPAVKFRGLIEAADALDCPFIATGHYATVEQESGRYLIGKSLDPQKDQSYMLYGLDIAVRRRLLLPLGTKSDKSAVRALAAKYRLSAAGKKDSLDICFLEEGDSHGEFIARFTGSAPEGGEILDTEGRILGYHQGIHHYTVGQRRGLGVAASERLYVCGLDPEHRRVILGGKEKVETETVTLEDFILHAPLPAEGLTAKVRYRDRETAVQVELLGEGRARLHFAEPKTAAAPGQSAVIFYRNFVLAGGRIAGFEPLK